LHSHEEILERKSESGANGRGDGKSAAPGGRQGRAFACTVKKRAASDKSSAGERHCVRQKLNMDQLPDILNFEKNRSVLEYLSGQSAHSDVAEALRIAIEQLGAAQTYCPDPGSFRYLVAYVNETVFSYAAGMKTIAFRLSSDFKKKAIKTGGEALDFVGNEWVAFELFRNDWPEVDVRFWARKAYLFARGEDDA